MSTYSAILTRTLSFDILIRGLLSGGVLFSGTLLGGVRRATPGLVPRMGPLLTAVVPPGATFHWCEHPFTSVTPDTQVQEQTSLVLGHCGIYGGYKCILGHWSTT